jgi:hypothetical protein
MLSGGAAIVKGRTKSNWINVYVGRVKTDWEVGGRRNRKLSICLKSTFFFPSDMLSHKGNI